VAPVQASVHLWAKYLLLLGVLFLGLFPSLALSAPSPSAPASHALRQPRAEINPVSEKSETIPDKDMPGLLDFSVWASKNLSHWGPYARTLTTTLYLPGMALAGSSLANGYDISSTFLSVSYCNHIDIGSVVEPTLTNRKTVISDTSLLPLGLCFKKRSTRRTTRTPFQCPSKDGHWTTDDSLLQLFQGSTTVSRRHLAPTTLNYSNLAAKVLYPEFHTPLGSKWSLVAKS
jgi:hypothetical protein